MNNFFEQNEFDESTFLQEYEPSVYAEKYGYQSMTSDIVVFSVDEHKHDNKRKLNQKFMKVLLIERGGHPNKGKWALPGGFIGDDTPEEAAYRELRTETNVENIFLEPIGTWGEKNRDSRIKKRQRVISCAFMSLIDSNTVDVIAGDDAAKATWFEIRITEEKDGSSIDIEFLNEEQNITLKAHVNAEKTVRGVSESVSYRQSQSDLAFDHVEMIVVGLMHLRAKVKNKENIVFNLMPTNFTFSELQQTYEIILNSELLTPAFRRDMKNSSKGWYVEETGTMRKEGQHRPSELYHYVSRKDLS